MGKDPTETGFALKNKQKVKTRPSNHRYGNSNMALDLKNPRAIECYKKRKLNV